MKTSNKIMNILSAVMLAAFISLMFGKVAGTNIVSAFAFASFMIMLVGFKEASFLGTCGVNLCNCNAAADNTGQGCLMTMKVAKRPWIVNKYSSAGVLNGILLTATLNQVYFTAWLNNADPLARLYPLPYVHDITDAREEPVFQTTKDGLKWFVRNGVRSYKSMFMSDVASPQLTGILEGQRCTSPCKYDIDADGTIWGKLSSDGLSLLPVEMIGQSVAAIFTKPTDTEVTMLGYMFDYNPTEQDCQIRGIQASELVGLINPLYFNGLLDVNMTVNSSSHTGASLSITLKDNYGTLLNPETVKGLLVGAFAIEDTTASAAATFTMTSPTPGTYVFAFTGTVPAAGHTLVVTPTSNGFDFTAVIAQAIVMGA